MNYAEVKRRLDAYNKLVAEQRTFIDERSEKDADGSVKFLSKAAGDDLTTFHAREADLAVKHNEYIEAKAIWAAAVRQEEALAEAEGGGRKSVSDPDTVSDDGAAMLFSESMKRVSPEALSAFKTGNVETAIFLHLQTQIDDAVKSAGSLNFAEYAKSGGKKVISIPEEMVNAYKTLMGTNQSYGWVPHVPRIDKIMDYATREPLLADIIPHYPAAAPSFTYIEETTEENNAAPVAEAAAKPYSQFIMADQTVRIEVIAHLMAFTEQQMADVPQFMAFLTRRGLRMLDLKTEDQIISGTGTTPQLQGFTTKSGIQTQVKGTDTIPDALYKLFTKIQVNGFAEASHVVIHPTDWQDVQLMKTDDGLYIWGHPSQSGPTTIWGKPVIKTTGITLHTALTGDFPLYSGLFEIGGVQVAVTNSNNDDFEKNRLTARIEHRKGLAIFRAAAFGTADLS